MTQEEINSAKLTAQKTNYLNQNYTYLKNVNITEWDIKSAGLSVLKYKKALPEAHLKKLSEMPKHERTVKEGLLQRKFPKLAELIVNTLAEVRTDFVISNEVFDSEILTIKKDAIFLINHTPTNVKIKGFFDFRKKGTYSSFVLMNKKEFYYSGRTDELVIKGISEENQKFQKDFLLKEIKKILKYQNILHMKTFILF